MSDLEQTLRERFPSPSYRVSRKTYPAGTQFPAAMKSSTCHVLHGACTFVFGATSFSLSSGQQAELPAGTHQFRVLGSEPVDLVMVWKVGTSGDS